MATTSPAGPPTARTRVLYALLGLPLGVLGLTYVAVTVVAGTALSVTVVGLPLLAAGLLGARGLGGLHRSLAARLLGVGVAPPPPRPPARPGVIGWLAARLTDPDAWRAVAYLLVKAPLAVITFGIGLAFYGYGLAGLCYPAWWRLIPVQPDQAGRSHHGLHLAGGAYLDTWPQAVLTAVAGAVLLVVAPFALRAVLTLDRLAVRALLGATTRAGRIRDLEQSRAYAVADSAAQLRRIERDLHDGAQARLVALAMNLGAAKEHLAEASTDPYSHQLVDDAHRNAKQALVELRNLARGIHPPVLDTGLEPALATLAAGSPIPVDLTVALARRPSPAVETIAYFCVAELLTNVAKHSDARRAHIEVAEQAGLIRIRVTDNGRGGAEPVRPGGGLAGLAERVRTVDGRLHVSSPAGGPTIATVELPCGS
jgi:signal transduction histidine kinase